MLDPEEARRIGLVDETVPVERVVPRAIEWCESLLRLPRGPMLKTRRMAREELVAALREVDAACMDEVAEDWFGEETQLALRALVARLTEKK